MLQKLKQQLKEGKTLLQFGFFRATGEALGMIAPLIVAKFFSPELFASYSLAKMIMFFFTSLLVTSTHVPFIIFANQEKAKSGKINKSFSVQCTFFIFSILICLAATLGPGKYLAAFAKIGYLDLSFVLLGLIGFALKTFICDLFMALGQRIKNSVAEFVYGGLCLAIVVGLGLTGAINLRTVFAVYFVSAVVLVLAFLKTIDFKQLLPFELDGKYLKEMFNFTKWLIFGATAIYLINWGDNFVLRIFVPMKDIGVYNLGYQIFKGLTALTFIINIYFLPFVSEHIGDTEKLRRYLSNKRPKIFLAGFVGIVLLFVAAGKFFELLYGETYQGSVAVLRILLVASVLVLYTTFYLPVLNAAKKYKLFQAANIINIILNVILNIILVPRFGMYGAAVATVIAYSCKAAIVELYFRFKLSRILGL